MVGTQVAPAAAPGMHRADMAPVRIGRKTGKPDAQLDLRRLSINPGSRGHGPVGMTTEYAKSMVQDGMDLSLRPGGNLAEGIGKN